MSSRASQSLYHRLAVQGSALDQLISDVAIGVRSQRQFDELEAKAREIGQGVADAFRTPDRGQAGVTRRSWHD